MNNDNSGKEKRENPFSSLVRLTELPLTVACMAGIAIKLFKMAGGSMLLLLSLSSLSVFYLFAAISFTGSEKASHTDKIMLKLNGMGSSIGVMGILFLLQHWPGSRVMILASCGMLLGTVIYMIKGNSTNPELKLFDPRMIFRTIAIASLELILYFIR